MYGKVKVVIENTITDVCTIGIYSKSYVVNQAHHITSKTRADIANPGSNCKSVVLNIKREREKLSGTHALKILFKKSLSIMRMTSSGQRWTKKSGDLTANISGLLTENIDETETSQLDHTPRFSV